MTDQLPTLILSTVRDVQILMVGTFCMWNNMSYGVARTFLPPPIHCQHSQRQWIAVLIVASLSKPHTIESFGAIDFHKKL